MSILEVNIVFLISLYILHYFASYTEHLIDLWRLIVTYTDLLYILFHKCTPTTFIYAWAIQTIDVYYSVQAMNNKVSMSHDVMEHKRKEAGVSL